MSEVATAAACSVAVQMFAHVGSRVKLNDGSIWTIELFPDSEYIWLRKQVYDLAMAVYVRSDCCPTNSSGLYIIEVLS